MEEFRSKCLTILKNDFIKEQIANTVVSQATQRTQMLYQME